MKLKQWKYLYTYSVTGIVVFSDGINNKVVFPDGRIKIRKNEIIHLMEV